MLARIKELIDQYKAIIGAIVGVVTAILFFMDYFATKKELAILQCQMLTSIQLVDARQSYETYSNLIATINGQLNSSTIDPQVRAVLQQRVDEAKMKQSTAWQNQEALTKQLQPGACEKLVGKK